jgi:hypothetical protein
MYYSDFTHETPLTSISLAYVLKKSGFDNHLIVSCRVPANNIFRLAQKILQLTLELFIKILFKFYFPSLEVCLSHSIGVIAKKSLISDHVGSVK